MITENIIYFPHHQYNVATELVKNLKVCDVINYGYIKLRDLDKWLKGETISVKMGMLSPTKDGYRELSVVESALKRIKEQDSTSCFEDEDELIPVYVFISEDTDVVWREFLFNGGYKTAKKTASREGVKISRKNLSLEYAKKYNIDTAESLTLKEKKQKQIEEKIRKEKEEKERIIKEYEEKNGSGSYLIDLETQKSRLYYYKNEYCGVSLNLEDLKIYFYKRTIFLDDNRLNIIQVLSFIIWLIVAITNFFNHTLNGVGLILLLITCFLCCVEEIHWSMDSYKCIDANGKTYSIEEDEYKKGYFNKK